MQLMLTFPQPNFELESSPLLCKFFSNNLHLVCFVRFLYIQSTKNSLIFILKFREERTMVEKVYDGITSSVAWSCDSKISAGGVVRVTNISSPTTMVKASASEFHVVVESLTGQKRSTPSSSEHEKINVCFDNEYNPRGKALKPLNDELQC